MLKRQQTARSSSSSSRRENVAEHRHAAAVGCMAGLLHLSSKYKPRRRFLITFGRKPGKKVEDEEEVASPACKSEMGLVQGDCEEEKGGDKARHVRRLSCQVPRSPTLPAEIRRSNSVNSRTPEESFRLTTAAQTQPALVARLMGLEEIPSADQSAAEKRRKLLMSALEKCDEDLKAIKQIIDALRSGDSPRSTPVAKRKRIAKNEDAVSGEQPTPISVLRSFTRTPSAAASKVHIIKDGQMATAGMMMIKDGCAIDYDYLKQKVQQQKPPAPRRSCPRVEEVVDVCFFRKGDDDDGSLWQTKCKPPPPTSNRAKKEIVDKVCWDIAWGEKREVGRIGLVLQDYICRDLIVEMVHDLTLGASSSASSSSSEYSLPLEACKRSLRF